MHEVRSLPAKMSHQREEKNANNKKATVGRYAVYSARRSEMKKSDATRRRDERYVVWGALLLLAFFSPLR